MQADLLGRLHTAFAQTFKLPPKIAAQPGTTLQIRPNKSTQSWHSLFPIGKHVVMPVALDHADAVKTMLATKPANYRMTRADLIALWGEDHCETESEFFYALEPDHFASFIPASPFDVRRLTVADQPLLDAMVAQCTPSEQDAGDVSTGHEVAFGVFDGERVVAVASMYEWLACAELGVLTDPTYRGNGLGRAAVSGLAAHLFDMDETRPILYRHDDSNIGSGKIAAALNFTQFAQVWSVRLCS